MKPNNFLELYRLEGPIVIYDLDHVKCERNEIVLIRVSLHQALDISQYLYTSTLITRSDRLKTVRTGTTARCSLTIRAVSSHSLIA